MLNEWLCNESLFFVHCAVVISFLFFALFLGKEALIVFISASWVFANFFVTKQILLFGYEITASDVYAIGAMLGASVLQELWGRKVAIQSIWISFFTLIFATIMAWLHLQYSPSPNDTMHPHFALVLGSTPRLMLASFATFFASSRIEVILFGFLKRFSSIPFPIRSGLTASIVTFFDTFFFTWWGLYGIIASISDVFFMSYLVKLIIVFSTTPFLAFVHYLFPSRNSVAAKV